MVQELYLGASEVPPADVAWRSKPVLQQLVETLDGACIHGHGLLSMTGHPSTLDTDFQNPLYDTQNSTRFQRNLLHAHPQRLDRCSVASAGHVTASAGMLMSWHRHAPQREFTALKCIFSKYACQLVRDAHVRAGSVAIA